MKNIVSKRYHLLDSVRGVTMLSMILYHATYDLVYLYNVTLGWFDSLLGYAWQQSICWIFIFLSGMCWSLNSHPLKRGLLVSSLGILISFTTSIFLPDQLILFGILTFMGMTTLLMIPLHKLFIKMNPILGAFFSFLFFFLVRNLNNGFLGFENLHILKIPNIFYKIPLLFMIGLPSSSFRSFDYFSLFPWIFLYTAGFFTWNSIKDNNVILKLFTCRFYPIEVIGKHTLSIYMLHQPILIGIFELVNAVVKLT
ncbi:MAG TPA: heparan-alpha-glucosaminide N-acetyltransferase domain-containing protein [Lachnospiraceae bacterium]|nr:heparan-alpha-glucosaminide N-acetyltransferase domain-containing protein [Lachnospiraceae bacterium]